MSNLDIFRSKITDETLNALDRKDFESIAEDQIQILEAISREKKRQAQIGEIYKQNPELKLQESAMRGIDAFTDFGHGVRSGVPGLNQAKDYIASKVTGKSYEDLARKSQEEEDVAWKESPYLYGAGKVLGTGFSSAGLGKVLPLALGKTDDLVGAAKLAERLKNVIKLGAEGSIFGAGTQVSGDTSPLSNVGEKGGIGAATNIAGGTAIPALLKGGYKVSRRLFYGTPMAITEEALKNVNKVFKGDSSKTGRDFGALLLNNIKSSSQDIGNIIENTLNQATANGVEIPMDKVVKIIDDEVARLNKLDKTLSPDVESQIDGLIKIKKEFLTPKVTNRIRLHPESSLSGIEDVTTTLPEETQSTRFVQRVAEMAPESMQPAARAEAFNRFMQDEFNVEVPKEFLKKNYNWDAIKQRIANKSQEELQKEFGWLGQQGEKTISNGTWDDILKKLSNDVEMVTGNETQGSYVSYPERSYTYPDEVNYNIPEPGIEYIPNNPDPYKTVSPNLAQNIKTSIKDKFGLFRGKDQDFLDQIVGAIGSEQRTAIPELGKIIPEERIVNIPLEEGGGFDLWSNLQGEKKNIANKLFGTQKIPQNPSDTQLQKAIVNIVQDSDGSVMKTLEKVLPKDQVNELKKLAITAYAQSEFQGNNALRPYLKNKGLYMALRSILGTLGIGGAAGAGFAVGGVPGSLSVLAALGGGMAATSNPATRAFGQSGRVIKVLPKTKLPLTAAQILTEKYLKEK